MKKYKYLFIDLDDTVWNFHSNAKKSLNEIFYNENLNDHYSDFEDFYYIYTKRNIELWTQYGQGLITKDYLSKERFLHMLRHVGMPNDDRALRMNSSFLDMLPTKNELIPHAKELLEICRKKNIPVTVISNGFVEVQYRKIRNSDIEKYFAHIVLSEQARALKPDPGIFNYALKLNHAKKEEVLMVGDSFEADVVGAINSGIDAYYLNPYDFPVDTSVPVGKYTKISSLKELFDLF